MDVIVLGQCKTIREGYAIFQFSGYWRDQKIKQIRVKSSHCWKREGEYILQLKVTRLEDKVLWTKLIRAKLFD